MGPRSRLFISAACLAVSLLLYGWGVSTAEIFDADARARQTFLSNMANTGDAVEIKTLAEAYWRRNPDVARDVQFGRGGAMGIFGPREHYRRHGKDEGRRWGGKI